MATNDFQVFAGATGSNVLSQAAYLALQARNTGFNTGIAQSPQLNKVWRQASIIAAMIAQFIVDQSGQNALDDGTIATLEASFIAALQASNRIKVPVTGTSLFVATNGSDNNPGTLGSPFQTMQKAATVALQNYDTQGNDITVSVASGTYTTPTSVTGSLVGGGRLRFVGNVSTPSSVVVNLTVPGTCFAVAGASVTVSGMTLGAPQGSSSVGQIPGDCIVAAVGGTVVFDHLVFTATQRAHLEASSGGRIIANGSYTISGSAGNHAIVGLAQIVLASQTITLTGTPNFSIAFATADGGNIGAQGASFSGAATGQRYFALEGGSISTSGAGINFLPGSIAGNSAQGYYT